MDFANKGLFYVEFAKWVFSQLSKKYDFYFYYFIFIFLAVTPLHGVFVFFIILTGKRFPMEIWHFMVIKGILMTPSLIGSFFLFTLTFLKNYIDPDDTSRIKAELYLERSSLHQTNFWYQTL